MKITRLTLVVLVSLTATVAAMDRLTFYTEEYPPYNYQGEYRLEGLAIELLEAIFEEVGTKLSRADVRLVPWARGYYAAMHVPDSVLFSTTRTPSREAMFEWVGPISPDRVVLLAHRNNAKSITSLSDIETRQSRIVVIRDDIGALRLIEQGIPESALRYAVSSTSALAMLEAGRVDFWAYGENVARWLMRENDYNSDDFISLYTLSEAELYFAIHKDTDPELIQRMQQALDTVRARDQIPVAKVPD